MKHAAALVALLLTACATPLGQKRSAPLLDYHQHLVSDRFAPLANLPARDGRALVRELDAAGIKRAVVLSVAYSFADERKNLPDPDVLTREENDWTSAEVARNAPRLIGFCSANPLRDAALAELDRCLKLPGMVGIKLHWGNAGVTLRNPQHLLRMRQLFSFAERRHAPLLIHMRARGGADYGAEDARLFMDVLLPVAPSIEIVVAHLGASSPGYGAQNDEVMQVFANAAQRKDRRVRNLFIDTAANIDAKTPADAAALAATRMRQFGLRKILYGSDLSAPGGSIAASWSIFKEKMPLTPAELDIIMANRTRFSR